MLLNDFRLAIAEAHTTKEGQPELVPMALARACVQVLPVAGAGISLIDEIRVTLAASDAAAARAERLQTTLGEGPCLTAASAAEPVTADLTTLAAVWPEFHRKLVAQTPYRSVVSVPLLARDGITALGALNLYLTTPDVAPDLFWAHIPAGIAAPISHVLFDHAIRANPNALPPWLNHASVTQWKHVWVAAGILMQQAGLSNDDALAALRDYSNAHDVTIDDTADRLGSQALHPGAVLGTFAAS